MDKCIVCETVIDSNLNGATCSSACHEVAVAQPEKNEDDCSVEELKIKCSCGEPAHISYVTHDDVVHYNCYDCYDKSF